MVTRADLWTGFWRLADPKISITSVACMIVGGAVAAVDGPLDWTWLGITGLALFCMEVAKNAWGDVFDFDSGTDQAVAPEDRTDFSGGKRVLVDGLLTRAQTWGMALAFGGVGVALGMLVVFWREPAALWLGVVGLALGWCYHGPPLRFAYRGLGELDVVLCYGPLIVLGTYWIQAQRFAAAVLWLSLPLGLLIAAFLWVNEFPDYRADVGAKKRNLVVRLGRERASRALCWIYAAAFAILAAIPALTGLPQSVWFGFVAAPAAAYASAKTLQAPTDFYRSSPVQPAALLAFNLYALGAGIGVMAA